MYKTKIDESHGKPYLKVFVENDDMIEDTAELLNNLPNVRTANISDKLERDITVYPRETHSIEELQEEVEKALAAAG